MEWKSASEIIQLLIEQGQALSGMTASEAAAALGFKQLSNGMFVKTATTTASNVINITGGTAAEAFAAGEATITGGATTTAANLTLIEGGAVGTTSAAGILSVAVPIGACLIAAISGYGFGSWIYENNQEFFDNLTGPLMEYCIEGTTNLMAMIDSNGNTYFDSRVCDIIKNYLDSYQSNYNPTENSTVINSSEVSVNLGCYEALSIMYNKFLATTRMPEEPYNDLGYNQELLHRFANYIDANYPNAKYILYISNTFVDYHTFPFLVACIFLDSFSYTIEKNLGESDGYTYIEPYEYKLKLHTAVNIKRVTFLPKVVTINDNYDYHSLKNDIFIKYKVLINAGTFSTGQYLSVHSEKILTTSGCTDLTMANFALQEISTLPQGVEKFVPNLSELLNPIKVLTGFDSEGEPKYTPYYPVAIPLGDPLTIPQINPTDDPRKTKDPNVATPYIPVTQPYPNGAPALSPSTNPQNSPLPNPVPATDTNPYPLPNPSVDPSVTPTTGGTNPTKLPSPSNEGTSPRPNMPIIPPLSSSANGLLHVYNPTNEQINSFGSWLWTTFSGDLIDTLAKIFNNPMDAVIGLHEIYITPTTANTTTIKAGFLDSGVPSKLVGDRYTEINCGSITVPEYWGNYLDYSPYTKTYCYLPFIGIVELSTDDIVGHGVNVTYKIDSFTGSCIAIITVAKTGYDSIVYQYPGNCAVEIPITSGIKGALQSALIGAATSAIAVASGGGAVVATAALAGGAKSGLNSKNEVSHSGSFGSTYGAMGAKKPFIIVKRPNQKVVPGYNTNYGYPAHTMVLISACSGYLRAKEVDVISVTATEEEKKMIETMLKSGIFVS